MFRFMLCAMHRLTRTTARCAPVLATLGLALASEAATLTVNNAGDTPPYNTTCKLRAAVQAMNVGNVAGTGCVNSSASPFGSGDLILIDATVTTITLTDAPDNHLRIVINDLQIDGGGHNVVIERNIVTSVNEFRVIKHDGMGTLRLLNLTIRGGRAVNPSVIASERGGGGVRSRGSVVLNGSIVRNNLTRCTSCPGGGVLADGAVSLFETAVIGNTTFGDDSYGGGVASTSGVVEATSATVYANRTEGASSFGGGIYSKTDTRLVQSRIYLNQTVGNLSAGGGVYAGDKLLTQDSELSGNTTLNNGSGAGAYVAASADVQTTSFVANVASGTEPTGGALFVAGETTLSTVGNTTFSGNAVLGSAANAAFGGAIYMSGALAMVNSTLVNNITTARAGAIFLGGIAPELSLDNTIVANSILRVGSSANAGVDIDSVSPITVSGADNLVQRVVNVTVPATTLRSDPEVLPLADNGCFRRAGATGDAFTACPKTHRLADASPARDTGRNASDSSYDQRGVGFPRLIGPRVDIGAIENPMAVTPVASTPVPTVGGWMLIVLTVLLALVACSQRACCRSEGEASFKTSRWHRLLKWKMLRRTVGAAALFVLTAEMTAASAASVCPFDNGQSDAVNDGVVLTRYALGITGAPLTASTRYASLDPLQVKSNIECMGCALDINGDGTVDTVDTTIIARHLSGFKGASLTAGLALGGGTRGTAAAVSSFLVNGCAVGGAISAFVQGGNAFGQPAVLGTNDAQSLSLISGGTTAAFTLPGGNGLRMQINGASARVNAPNTLLGSASNSVLDATAAGATISGGGASEANCYEKATDTNVRPCENRVGGQFGTVAGGLSNQASDYGTVSGGVSNTANGASSVVAGGSSNRSLGGGAVVSGGQHNVVTASSATVSGGFNNSATARGASIAGGSGNVSSGVSSAVGGGESNHATGNFSTVPGGTDNVASGVFSFAAGIHAKATHDRSFVWGGSATTTTSSTGDGSFVVYAPGSINMYAGPAGAGGCSLTTPSSGWACSSDRTLKTNIRRLDVLDVLARVVAMPVTRWSFRGAEPFAHIGPMAQDFKAAFGLGGDDKTISPMDSVGVALAAIQGLSQQLKARDQQIDSLKQITLLMRREMASMKAQLNARR